MRCGLCDTPGRDPGVGCVCVRPYRVHVHLCLGFTRCKKREVQIEMIILTAVCVQNLLNCFFLCYYSSGDNKRALEDMANGDWGREQPILDIEAALLDFARGL